MNSLFFDYPCKAANSDTVVPSIDLAWCKSENVLACAMEHGGIAFYEDEGAEIISARIRRDNNQRSNTMEWSPRGKILGVGWTDGQVSIWNVMEPLRKSASVCTCANLSIHRLPVTLLIWNQSGTRLVTGDVAGIVCIWKVDGRGNVTPSLQYRRNSTITAAVFCPVPAQTTEMMAQVFSLSFFFATETGMVCYADDLGHCTDVQQLTSSVDRLVFYEETRRLVIITRSLLMAHQLCVGEDEIVSQFMKVKLSVSAASLQESGLREV
ncbi:unnamed protein product, partial [Choristocarpus tenellus]